MASIHSLPYRLYLLVALLCVYWLQSFLFLYVFFRYIRGAFKNNAEKSCIIKTGGLFSTNVCANIN